MGSSSIVLSPLVSELLLLLSSKLRYGAGIDHPVGVYGLVSGVDQPVVVGVVVIGAVVIDVSGIVPAALAVSVVVVVVVCMSVVVGVGVFVGVVVVVVVVPLVSLCRCRSLSCFIWSSRVTPVLLLLVIFCLLLLWLSKY